MNSLDIFLNYFENNWVLWYLEEVLECFLLKDITAMVQMRRKQIKESKVFIAFLGGKSNRFVIAVSSSKFAVVIILSFHMRLSTLFILAVCRAIVAY